MLEPGRVDVGTVALRLLPPAESGMRRVSYVMTVVKFSQSDRSRERGMSGF
jgi:hypothetical protein